jgi:hypothetical protein
MPTRILYPRDGDRFVAAAGALVQVEIAGRDAARLTLDGRPVRAQSGAYLVPLRSGTHELVARSRSGTSSVHFSAGPHVTRGRTGFTIEPAPRLSSSPENP